MLGKVNVLKLDDLDKFEIAKLMHPACKNYLPPQFSALFYSCKSGTHKNNETGINGTWACTFQDLEQNNYKTVLNIKESKYGAEFQKTKIAV